MLQNGSVQATKHLIDIIRFELVASLGQDANWFLW